MVCFARGQKKFSRDFLWSLTELHACMQASRMPGHLDSMRREVSEKDKASFFKLHNLAGDR
jgi:hypothetical protein